MRSALGAISAHSRRDLGPISARHRRDLGVLSARSQRAGSPCPSAAEGQGQGQGLGQDQGLGVWWAGDGGAASGVVLRSRWGCRVLRGCFAGLASKCSVEGADISKNVVQE